MIEIDKTDKLYTYLTKLGAVDIDKLYLELAQNGRYTPKDVQTYFYADFQPSLTNDLEDRELESLIDYYSDLKKVKPIKQTELNQLLKRYKTSKAKQDKDKIINAKLKDVMHLAINYKSSHPEVDLQDIAQVANLGLIKAVEKFNPTNKIALKDYIIFWVREEVNKEFKNA